jgi:hypothetical protein
MTNNVLRIRFIRKDAPQNGSTDDVVTIRCLSLKLYGLQYSDGKKESPEIVMNDMSVYRYVRNLIDLYKMDADPFESLQFDFPLMPTVLISFFDLGSSKKSLLEAIQFHLDHLTPPSQQKKESVVTHCNNKVNATRNRIVEARIQHIFFDE